MEINVFPPAYLEGVRLFNAGLFYEAHEVLEEVWRERPKGSPERIFYQALIQIAAAYLHREKGRWRPALRQYERALEKLESLGNGTFLGLDLRDLKETLHTDFADAEEPIPSPMQWHLLPRP